MHSLLLIATALFAGLLMTRLFVKLHMPDVTAYLVTGVLIGPCCLGALGISGLGFTSFEEVESLSVINDVALGFIAFAIGTEFKMSSLKKTGKQATVIGIVQAVFAMILVDAVLIGLSFVIGQDKLPLPVCVTLGAIATATAPAATLMVVKQYKAKGPVTNILLPVVALDDAVGLVCFAVSIGVAQALVGGGEALNVISLVINPLLEVVLSLILGSVVGVIFTVVENMFLSNSKRLCLSITFVLLTIALSQLSHTFSNGIEIKFSNLLVCMMLGTIFCNICDSADELMEKTDKWTMPIFILFFVISGAELEFSFFKNWVVIVVGIVYILTRALGKYTGAALSAKATKCDKNIVKYLGITLVPQAGVAIGMSIIAVELLGSYGATVRNIVLFGVLIYELVGPLLTKIALTKAGDIVPKQSVQPAHHLTVAEVFADDPDDEDDE